MQTNSCRNKRKFFKFLFNQIRQNYHKFNKKLQKIKILNKPSNSIMKIYLKRNQNNNLKSKLNNKIKNLKKINFRLSKYNLTMPEHNKIITKISEKISTSNSNNLIPNSTKSNWLFKRKRKPSKNFKNNKLFKTKNSTKFKKSMHPCLNLPEKSKNNYNLSNKKLKENSLDKWLLKKRLNPSNKKLEHWKLKKRKYKNSNNPSTWV